MDVEVPCAEEDIQAITKKKDTSLVKLHKVSVLLSKPGISFFYMYQYYIQEQKKYRFLLQCLVSSPPTTYPLATPLLPSSIFAALFAPCSAPSWSSPSR